MSSEKRKNARRALSRQALIILDDRSGAVLATISDISESGAMLQLDPTFNLPQRFALALTRDGKVRRRCRLVRQAKGVIGVRFIRGEPANRGRGQDRGRAEK